ncbi:carbon starvation CstA family protein [Haematospirillum jordaniae]|uniref:carbon starvation CstA family protein n=2 Tax=Haematospirillum TaxID=1804663 RepID=UPI0024763672|nr:carbon starvation CstA family protein [Haematospirillum jordaniae]
MENALTFVIVAICVLAICYRFYGVFIVKNVLGADDSQITPAHKLADGRNYVPTR